MFCAKDLIDHVRSPIQEYEGGHQTSPYKHEPRPDIFVSNSPRDKARKGGNGGDPAEQRAEAFVLLGMEDDVVRNNRPARQGDYHLHRHRHKRENAIKEKADNSLPEYQEQETLVDGPTAT